MTYQEIKPSGLLNNFIRYFWIYEHTYEDIEYTILPDASFDLLADFEHKVLQNIILTGVWKKPIKVTVTKGTTLLAIRFKIIAAEYLFQREIKSLLNTMVSLPIDFWNINSLGCNELENFVATLSNQMISSLEQLENIDNRKLKLFNLIYSGEYHSVKELSELVFWSSRQLNRYFNYQYGFPLKEFLNIMRCNDSYKDIVNGNLYPSKEYTDQSHFIKEIKKYTENTPSQLSKNEDDRFLQLFFLKKE